MCSACHLSLPDDAAFCPRCGAPAERITSIPNAEPIVTATMLHADQNTSSEGEPSSVTNAPSTPKPQPARAVVDKNKTNVSQVQQSLPVEVPRTKSTTDGTSISGIVVRVVLGLVGVGILSLGKVIARSGDSSAIFILLLAITMIGIFASVMYKITEKNSGTKPN